MAFIKFFSLLNFEILRHEKLTRKDHKYDLLIPIKYNFKKPIPGKVVVFLFI